MYKYAIDESVEAVKVRAVHYTHTVNPLEWKCDCNFASSMKLPCRHAMAFRKHRGISTIMPFSRIHLRYFQ